jgi:hypothetical protein
VTRVRALRAHTNNFGPAFQKAAGDEYEHPAPAQLIKHRFVEAVDPVADDVAAFAETFIARKLDDISDEEIAGLSEAERQAVAKAEQDREKPRAGLIGRLGIEA